MHRRDNGHPLEDERQPRPIAEVALEHEAFGQDALRRRGVALRGDHLAQFGERQREPGRVVERAAGGDAGLEIPPRRAQITLLLSDHAQVVFDHVDPIADLTIEGCTLLVQRQRGREIAAPVRQVRQAVERFCHAEAIAELPLDRQRLVEAGWAVTSSPCCMAAWPRPDKRSEQAGRVAQCASNGSGSPRTARAPHDPQTAQSAMLAATRRPSARSAGGDEPASVSNSARRARPSLMCPRTCQNQASSPAARRPSSGSCAS